jgi:hypothetical protein
MANVPDDLVKEWLQHLRDFDIAHPGCHFKIIGDTDASLADIKGIVKGISPSFDFQAIFKK